MLIFVATGFFSLYLIGKFTFTTNFLKCCSRRINQKKKNIILDSIPKHIVKNHANEKKKIKFIDFKNKLLNKLLKKDSEKDITLTQQNKNKLKYKINPELQFKPYKNIKVCTLII